jgi:hypothetical protein
MIFAGLDIECGEQAGGAVALLIVRAALDLAGGMLVGSPHALHLALVRMRSARS